MYIGNTGSLQLTYCTNIHPAQGWEAVNVNLRKYAPALRQQFAPDGVFGLGLRLSAREAGELLAPGRLDELRSFLVREGLYVALLNGFPYGSFHGTVVKANVFAPDWRDEARLRYTLDLVKILVGLLPDGVDGGISTVPLSYKHWLRGEMDREWEAITSNLVRLVEELVRIRRDDGRFVHLDIEPEPDGLIENSDEVVKFFRDWLLPVGGSFLATALGTSVEEARKHLSDHIQVCFDCCHFAVEYEDPVAALKTLEEAGIRIGRVQLSSALKVVLPATPELRAGAMERLAPFAESTYLHQVIEKSGSSMRRFPDLPVALSEPHDRTGEQWRIHFHVPLFTSDYEQFGSTQDYVRSVLTVALRARFTQHLEIETYTWDVLPADLKLDLLESIGREYRWVLTEMQACRKQSY